MQVLHRLDQHTHGWLGIILTAGRSITKPENSFTAAAIAYFALFSLFPIILVSISIASFNLTPLLSQQAILNRLEFVAPALGNLIGPNIQRVIHSRGPVTVVALISLLWSASNVFNTLDQAMSDLWGQRKKTPMWERRGLAILVVLIFAGPALILLSFAGSVYASLSGLLPDQIVLLTDVTSIIFSIVLDIALFTVLYTIFPHGASTWREILPGSLAAGLIWELAKRAFLAFISSYLSTSNLIYGSVAAIIAFLTWAHLSGLIFLFGANINLAYFNLKQKSRENRPH
jgi:membrane protein